MTARRITDPVYLQYIWDALEVPKCEKTFDFIFKFIQSERDSKCLTSKLQNELNNAVTEKCLILKGDQYKRREWPLIRQNGRHDWYCFHCHAPGVVVSCPTCFRVYHVDCLSAATELIREPKFPDEDPSDDVSSSQSSNHLLPPSFPCPSCKRISESALRKETTTNDIHNVFLTVLERVRKKNHWRTLYTVGYMNEPYRNSFLTFRQINSKIISEKLSLNPTKPGGYPNRTSFLSDLDLLVHNTAVIYGSKADMTNIARQIRSHLQKEMRESSLCVDCYLRAKGGRPDSKQIVEVCRKPHRLIWYQHSSWSFRPCKILHESKDGYEVICFDGRREREFVPTQRAVDMKFTASDIGLRMTAPLKKALDETEKYKRNVKLHLSSFDPNSVSFSLELSQAPLPSISSHFCETSPSESASPSSILSNSSECTVEHSSNQKFPVSNQGNISTRPVEKVSKKKCRTTSKKIPSSTVPASVSSSLNKIFSPYSCILSQNPGDTSSVLSTQFDIPSYSPQCIIPESINFSSKLHKISCSSPNNHTVAHYVLSNSTRHRSVSSSSASEISSSSKSSSPEPVSSRSIKFPQNNHIPEKYKSRTYKLECSNYIDSKLAAKDTNSIPKLSLTPRKKKRRYSQSSVSQIHRKPKNIIAENESNTASSFSSASSSIFFSDSSNLSSESTTAPATVSSKTNSTKRPLLSRKKSGNISSTINGETYTNCSMPTELPLCDIIRSKFNSNDSVSFAGSSSSKDSFLSNLSPFTSVPKKCKPVSQKPPNKSPSSLSDISDIDYASTEGDLPSLLNKISSNSGKGRSSKILSKRNAFSSNKPNAALGYRRSVKRNSTETSVVEVFTNPTKLSPSSQKSLNLPLDASPDANLPGVMSRRKTPKLPPAIDNFTTTDQNRPRIGAIRPSPRSPTTVCHSTAQIYSCMASSVSSVSPAALSSSSGIGSSLGDHKSIDASPGDLGMHLLQMDPAIVKAIEDRAHQQINERLTVIIQERDHARLRLTHLKDYVEKLKSEHTNEIRECKKRSWCSSCLKEAIYHCCAGISYCSTECQFKHWANKHCNECRRLKENQPS